MTLLLKKNWLNNKVDQKKLVKLKQYQERQLHKRTEMVVKSCIVCSKDFESQRYKNQKFCSRGCANSQRYKNNKVIELCPNCNKEVEVTKSYLKIRKTIYCNKVCQKEHLKIKYKGKNNPNYKSGGYKVCKKCRNTFQSYQKGNYCSPKCWYERNHITFNCLNCKKDFVVSKYKKKNSKKVFCSLYCKNKFAIQEGNCVKKCEYCKKDFTVKKSLYNQKFCSVKCVGKVRSGWIKGEGNHMWEGGIGKTARGFRGSDWNEQRKKAYQRDDGACQRCGKQEDIAVHHIIPWKYTKDNDLMNLICLCRVCHMTEENYYRQFGKPSSLVLRIMETK